MDVRFLSALLARNPANRKRRVNHGSHEKEKMARNTVQKRISTRVSIRVGGQKSSEVEWRQTWGFYVRQRKKPSKPPFTWKGKKVENMVKKHMSTCVLIRVADQKSSLVECEQAQGLYARQRKKPSKLQFLWKGKKARNTVKKCMPTFVPRSVLPTRNPAR